MAETREQLPRDASAPAFAERHFEVDGLRRRYLEGGQGPPVIHLPGASGLRWEPVHERLAVRFRVMVFDAPEPGPSSGIDRDGSAADPVRALARAAEGLGLDRYGLLGTSSDGAVALRLAAEHPDRIEALVLESPPALAWPGDAAGAGPDVAGTVPSRGADGRDAELAARLAGLAVPVLALFGTRDRTIPREAARRYREHLPHCHVMLVYDAGHAIAADRPEAVASLVADFLERREQFVVSRAAGLLHR